MKNDLIKLTSDKPSCAGFDDQYLYLSFQVGHETFDALKKAAGESKSAWGAYTVVELRSIREITCYQKGTNFFFRYDKRGKQKKYGLEISDIERRMIFCEDLAKASGLKTKTEKNNPYSRVQVNIIPIIMIALFTCACCLGASDIIAAPSRTSKGRLMSDALKAIGPTAILIIGLSLIGFFLFRLLRNIKQSDTKFVYSF